MESKRKYNRHFGTCSATSQIKEFHACFLRYVFIGKKNQGFSFDEKQNCEIYDIFATTLQGIRKFKCESCEYESGYKQDLKRHKEAGTASLLNSILQPPAAHQPAYFIYSNETFKYINQ